MLFLWLCVCLSILSTNVLRLDALPTDPSDKVPISSQRFRPFPSSLTQGLRNDNDSNLQHMTGCFQLGPGKKDVSPQDAVIALGLAANVRGFFSPRLFEKSVILANWNTAVIGVIRMGFGSDEFSFFDIIAQAVTVVQYCVYQQLPASRLGGAIEVGSQNQFRVVVQAPSSTEKILSEPG